MEKKFSLTLPSEEEIKNEIKKATAPDEKRSEQISAASLSQVESIINADIDNPGERADIIKTIESFGNDAVSASNKKNEFLAKRIVAFKNNSDETGVVANGLTELSLQMRSLDPSGIKFSSASANKLFNPVKKYFTKYERADKLIDSILESITNGEKQLKNDNQTLLIEQQSLEKETVKLGEYIALGKEFDSALSQTIERARLEGEDERKIAFLESEVLFPLRQKVMDMGTLSAVNYQGIGAIDVIRKNNLELIRGVERAKQVSVAALRIGVMCAQALFNQNLVLRAVNTLTESTARIIESNASMLKSQSGEIQELAANPMISVDTLKQSFETVFTVLDECEAYKRNALPQMAAMIEAFSEIGEQGAERIKRLAN